MKKITSKVILMALLFTTKISFSQTNTNTQTLFGQELTDANKESLERLGIIKCASVEYEEFLKALYPERVTNAEFESWLAPKIEAVKAQRSSGTSTITTLPVVFHILTDGDGDENLSQAAIQEQIDQLNLDFSDNTGSTSAAAADTEVRFCLAQQNESGVPLSEPGINRIIDYGDIALDRSFLEATVKPATQWDPERYLNIWIAKTVTANAGALNLLGYAQFPSNSALSGLNESGGSANTDGVVIKASSVGSVASPNPNGGSTALGRTLTHEVGHWLGLRHIWGDSSTCENGDYCADTPDSTQPNYSCIVPVDRCPDDNLGNDMVENYMDYSDDDCMTTLTVDQTTRIQAVLANSPRRMELGASTVCSPAIVYDLDGAIELDNLNLVDCATTFTPTVVVTNMGTTTLTSAVISCSIDTDSAVTQSWSGSLDIYQSETVTLPTMNVSGGSHIFTIGLLSPNGSTDENTVDNTEVSSAFSTYFDTATVNLTLLTDEYGDETSWVFKDSGDTILYSGETDVYSNETTYNHTFDVLTGGCYSFTIYDLGEDGICCDWGSGSYTLTDSNSNVIATGGEFLAQESVSLTVNTLGIESYLLDRKITLYPNPATNVLNIKVGASNSLPDTYKIYNMLGQIVLQQSIGELSDLVVNTSSLSKGMYFIKIATDNASISLPFVKK